MLSADDQPRPGLRERKKAKTRAAIQRFALRLFLEQGYEATTVEQIAEAAEVSPSTFFRYFPTKEDVALYDDLDPLLIAAFDAQPANLSPIQALQAALHHVLDHLPEETLERQSERAKLVFTVPTLRMRMLDQFTDMIGLISHLAARRTGRNPNDLTVRVYAGAVIGGMLASMLDGAGLSIEAFIARMDESLEYLESGLRL